MKRKVVEKVKKNKKSELQNEIIFPEAYRISQDQEELIEFLQEKKVLLSKIECECGEDMKLNKRKNISDNYHWRCWKCNKNKSIRTKSIFEIEERNKKKYVARLSRLLFFSVLG